ncbi:MAG TPA: helix-turn-helix domain-containing protein, partial [Mycobacteriales bacterium]|nr:helix-turn-helix domain-containing protein [Mycobacteriales bacterium]
PTAARLAVFAEALQGPGVDVQRRLAADGTTFERVVDDARRAAAHRLLTQTDLPLTRVAAMIELAGSPSLTRAVRRWFGRTPSELRRDAVAARRSVAQR